MKPNIFFSPRTEGRRWREERESHAPKFGIRGSGEHSWPTWKKEFDESTCTGPLGNKRTVVLGRIGSGRMKNSNAWKHQIRFPRLGLLPILE